jgi:hypothetical protein
MRLQRTIVPSMFPGLVNPSRVNTAGDCSRVIPRRLNKAARPDKPLNGFVAELCKPLARSSSENAFNAKADISQTNKEGVQSTLKGSDLSLLNHPISNISKLPIAKPSLRPYLFPCLVVYFQTLPAPASRRTETTNKSSNRRVRSADGMFPHD